MSAVASKKMAASVVVVAYVKKCGASGATVVDITNHFNRIACEGYSLWTRCEVGGVVSGLVSRGVLRRTPEKRRHEGSKRQFSVYVAV